MSWHLDDVRIFVQKFERVDSQIIAKLQPLQSLSSHHIFGAESEVYTIEAYIVGNDDFNSLKSMTRDFDTHILTGPYSLTLSGVLVKKLGANLMSTICQTMRPDLPETSPVYIINLELWLDE